MRERAIEQELATLRGPGSERMIDARESERLVREQPFADSLPPYNDLFTTADRTLWVVDAIVPDDTAWTATAFRLNGAMVGRLRVSGSGMALAFDNDRVVVRTTDNDGVVAMEVRRIVPTTAPPAKRK